MSALMVFRDSIKVGFETDNLKAGPKVFMSRLKEQLQREECFSEENYNIWIHTTVTPLPDKVKKKRRRGKCKVLMRSAGARNIDFTPHIIGSPAKLLDPIVNYPLSKYFNRFLYKNIYKENIDYVIYQSEFSKQSVERLFGKTPVANSIIHNGVDLDVFKPAENRRNNNEADFPRILISHYFKPKKRAQQSPLIIKELLKKYPNTKVVLVGSTFRDTMKIIKGEIARHNLEKHFDILGYVPFEQIYEIYSKADFMLCLSYDDPCPNVVVEALACGLPVVYTNTGGVPEIVADAGVGVDENIDLNKRYIPHFSYKCMPQINPDDYVQAVEKLMDNYQYYHQKVSLRRDLFSIKNVAGRYMEVVEKL